MFNYNSDGDANYTPVILRQPKAIPSIQKDDFIAVRTRSAKFSLSLNRPNKVKHKDKVIQMDTSHSSVSHANQSAIKKPVQSTPNPDEAIQMDTSHSSVSHANQSAIKKPVQSTPNPDEAIQMDTSHSSVSHANQSAIKKTTPNPDKAIQMDTNHSTNSSANQPASKKPVQSVLNPDKVMDTKDLSFNHKKSTPSPHKTTQVDANLVNHLPTKKFNVIPTFILVLIIVKTKAHGHFRTVMIIPAL